MRKAAIYYKDILAGQSREFLKKKSAKAGIDKNLIVQKFQRTNKSKTRCKNSDFSGSKQTLRRIDR